MIPLKSCVAALSWIASSFHLHPKRPRLTFLDRVSKGINEGVYADPLTKGIQDLAEKETQSRKNTEYLNGN